MVGPEGQLPTLTDGAYIHSNKVPKQWKSSLIRRVSAYTFNTIGFQILLPAFSSHIHVPPNLVFPGPLQYAIFIALMWGSL
ncbi:hypothetical protein MRB53_029773 [Persea americana]|uniref:Uncharacterized protein n=1 Tax=Persea americana TaxID=3435 RepID=A0ACC2KJA0_PERAE|nr:hypothetical protein MRB53_029773 [Persea americana]